MVALCCLAFWCTDCALHNGECREIRSYSVKDDMLLGFLGCDRPYPIYVYMKYRTLVLTAKLGVLEKTLLIESLP